MKSLQRIGQGYYYNVCDLENGRVLKTQTSHATRIQKLLSWRGKTFSEKIRIPFTYPLYVRDAEQSLIRSIETSQRNQEMFGNPRFGDAFSYEQDRAVPLEVYFRENRLEANLQRFDEYLRLLQTLWTYGLSDTVFNFTINNGVSLRTDRVIYLDFNEYTESREVITECIKTEKWFTQAALRDMPPSPLRSQIILRMREEITLEKFNVLWDRAARN